MKVIHAFVASTLWAASAVAQAEATGNIGFLSDYVFRGVFQADSVANGGLDVDYKGFYAGTWGADVGQGLEVDLYGGYAGELGDFSYGVGYTGYFYTDDFDDTYQEINLKAGYGLFTFQYNVGEYENFDGPTLDYSFAAFSAEYGGFHALLGYFGDDFDGDYVDVGYSTELGGFDVGMSLIHSNEDLAGGASGESTLVFSISRSFTLGGAAAGD